MANLREVRRRFRWAAGALALLALAAIAVLISQVDSGAKHQRDFEDVRHQVQLRLRTVIPPDKVQSRVEEARTQIDDFYSSRVPATMSDISKQLGDVANQTGVHLLTATYNTEDAGVGQLQRVQINATLSGDYLQEVKFINNLERRKLFFIVDGVTLGEGQSGQVRLTLNLETYLKSST